MNIPTYLTIFRILLVPVLVVVLMTRVTQYHIIGIIVFWIASITDALDGYLARKWKQVTPLGKLLDPLADKLLVAGALLSLVELGLCPAWMAFIILGREIAITGLRGIAAQEGVTIAAERLGKWKLTAQIVAISCLILGPKLDLWLYMWTHAEIFEFFIQLNKPYSFVVGLGVITLWISMLLAVWSGVSYFHAFWRKVGDRIFAHEPDHEPSEDKS